MSRKTEAGADRAIPQAADSIEEIACLHKSHEPLDESELSTAEHDIKADQQEERTEEIEKLRSTPP